jgi:hypothetical protein
MRLNSRGTGKYMNADLLYCEIILEVEDSLLPVGVGSLR